MAIVSFACIAVQNSVSILENLTGSWNLHAHGEENITLNEAMFPSPSCTWRNGNVGETAMTFSG